MLTTSTEYTTLTTMTRMLVQHKNQSGSSAAMSCAANHFPSSVSNLRIIPLFISSLLKPSRWGGGGGGGGGDENTSLCLCETEICLFIPARSSMAVSTPISSSPNVTRLLDD